MRVKEVNKVKKELSTKRDSLSMEVKQQLVLNIKRKM